MHKCKLLICGGKYELGNSCLPSHDCLLSRRQDVVLHFQKAFGVLQWKECLMDYQTLILSGMAVGFASVGTMWIAVFGYLAIVKAFSLSASE